MIGPVGKSESQLDRALDVAFESVLVDRAIYLGNADLVRRRRRVSVPNLDEPSLWARSLRCLEAEPAVIERFVAAERRKLDWARLELLGETGRCSLPLADGRSLLICEDRSRLPADAAATVVVCGGRDEAASDGALDRAWLCRSLDEDGIVVVSDENEITVDVFDLRGKQLEHQVVESGRA